MANWEITNDSTTNYLRAQDEVAQNPIDFHEDGTLDSPAVDAEDLHTDQQPTHILKIAGGQAIAVGQNDIIATKDATPSGEQALLDAVASDLTDGDHVHFMDVIRVNRSANNGSCFNFDTVSGVTISAEGRFAGLKAADDAASSTNYGVIVMTPGPDAHIYNIALNGNRANQGTITDDIDGGNVVNAQNGLNMHDCWSFNSTGDGIEAKGQNVRVHNNHFWNNEEQDVHFWNEYSRVTDNLCVNCKEDGAIRTTSEGNKDLQGIEIRDNTIVDPITNGIWVSVSGGYQAIEPVVEGNTILKAGDSNTSKQQQGIRVTTSVRPQIKDNRVINPVGIGIEVTTSSVNSPRIRNNYVKGAGERGIVTYECSDPRVEQNTVELCDTDAIVVDGGSITYSRAAIRHNECVDNNQSDSTNSGIYVLNGGPTAIIEGNTVESTGSIQTRRGIKAGSSVTVELKRNRVRGMEFSDYSIGGSIAKVIRNDPRIVLSSPPSNADAGDEYLDDGTNTSSGTQGVRAYLGGAWVDAYTA